MDLSSLLPIPDLLQAKRLVAFAPHPDDNEVGAGATIARLRRQGCEVIYVIATKGDAGSDDPQMAAGELTRLRQQEQRHALQILGDGPIIFWEYPDTLLRDHEKALQQDVLKVIREYQPDFVMAPDPWLPYEAHPDHRTLGHAVATGVIMAPFARAFAQSVTPVSSPAIAFYGSAWPNTYIDVTETFDLKLAALAAHESQFGPPLGPQLMMYLTLYAEENGQKIGAKRAEPFKVLTPHHLHFNAYTWRC
ncbi:PIG-L deacetylase family protein [Sulfobacillus thermosulfidooxidans]|uniref:PIG-L deacetylase family protein n=1 Tax=Sulfobacillus thermosulfidooxidans TaxID=28034 RepID=UPI0006B47F10|nr:PIG-L deacetylase family protein [Sulfobacillus thermosulfidooxidans]